MSKENYTFDDLEDILAEFSSGRKSAPAPVSSVEPIMAVETEPKKKPEQPREVITEKKDIFDEPVKARPARRPVDAASVVLDDFDEPAKVRSGRMPVDAASVDLDEFDFAAKKNLSGKPAKAAAADMDGFVPENRARSAKQPNTAASAEKTMAGNKNSKAPAVKSGSSFEEFEALFSRDTMKKQPAKKAAPAKPELPKPATAKPAVVSTNTQKKLDITGSIPVKNIVQAEAAQKEKKSRKLFNKTKKEKQPKAEKPELQIIVEEPQERKKFSPLHTLLSLLFAAVSLLVLVWVLFNVHPASGSAASTGGSAVLKMSDKLDVYMNNVASDALGELAYIKKIYTLQESDTVAPVPNPDNFGTTRDVAVIQDLIKRAAPLLEGQSVAFDPNADFVPDTDFMYYLDDTIMVIAWKEYINERCCTMAEVKIAHGSQIRRKLAEDSYSSSVQLYASDMANQSNAVIAINGDFYAFRDLGITVYQRKLYRNNPASVDSCFFTASGDMLFTRAGELMGEGETEQFIQDNDVVFAVAFGPILVENGELQYCASYPIGEINTEYSRSCIGMTDDLHYLLMTINHTTDARPRATINELARFIYSKGVEKAYALDGGQTAEIVMLGGPINHVDFGYERVVSDIIYFATAIPNEEVR